MAASSLLLLFGALLVPSAARTSVANASVAPTVVVTVGVLLPERNLSFPWAWQRVAPALSLALEALQPQLSHAGLAVRTAFASTEEDGTCNQHVVHYKAAVLKSSHDPDVLLGLGCLDTNDPVASFAHHWQLPLLRGGFYQRDLDSDFSTLVYLGPLGRDLSIFHGQLLRHFNWTSRIVFVFSPGIVYWHYDFFHWWYPEEFLVYPHFTYFQEYEQPGKAVQFIQDKGRVVYIVGSLEMLQQIMHLAEVQNMTNGDYVFFYMDILGESLRAEGHREAAKPWQRKESQDMEGLLGAFRPVLVITPHEPRTPEYHHFQSELILRAQRDFGAVLNDSMGHLVAGCFHDGLLLYLRALNETLHEGGTKRDTSRILEKMRSLKIQGVTGTVSINSDNVREMDFDLWAMRDVKSGEYQVVAHYIGAEKRINWTGQIHWKIGRPPLDNPPHVFDMDDPSGGVMLHDHYSPLPLQPGIQEKKNFIDDWDSCC